MTTEKWIRVIDGCVVLASLFLAVYVNNKWWLLPAAFVGLNLIQSPFTNYCLMERILKEFGVPGCCEEKKGGQHSN